MADTLAKRATKSLPLDIKIPYRILFATIKMNSLEKWRTAYSTCDK